MTPWLFFGVAFPAWMGWVVTSWFVIEVIVKRSPWLQRKIFGRVLEKWEWE